MSRWKRNDTLPDMVIYCFDDQGRRPDLTVASEVRVITRNRGVPLWEKVVTGDADGKVSVPLTSTDTGTTGTFAAKVKVTWPNGGVQHYPPADQWLTWTVTP